MKHGRPPIFLHTVQLDTATIFFISSMAMGDSVTVSNLKGTCCDTWVGIELYVWVWLLKYGGNEYLGYHSGETCSVFLVVQYMM